MEEEVIFMAVIWKPEQQHHYDMGSVKKDDKWWNSTESVGSWKVHNIFEQDTWTGYKSNLESDVKLYVHVFVCKSLIMCVYNAICVWIPSV